MPSLLPKLLPQFLDQLDKDARRDARIRFLQEGAPRFYDKWHWFQYHFSRIPPTPFGQSLIDACIGLERLQTGCGRKFFLDVAKIGGRDREWRDYDQILQKLAEILVINSIVDTSWPTVPSIQVEEHASGSRKGVDCVATLHNHKYGFEIKAPALLAHRKARHENPVQVPGRFAPREFLEMLADQATGKVTLPRDNPVYDFLVSANDKFSTFKNQGPFTGILVIVWDDFIYEPITSLLHEKCGLLTPNSYKRNNDKADLYPAIDVVILVRHLTYFTRAAAEEALNDGRNHAFHLGGNGALPNVVIPLRMGAQIPEYILEALWAYPLTDPWLQHAAEYHPSDVIWWHDVPAPIN